MIVWFVLINEKDKELYAKILWNWSIAFSFFSTSVTKINTYTKRASNTLLRLVYFKIQNSNMCFCSRLYGNLKCFDPRRRKTCLNGKRTCWKDRKKKRTRETQCNHIPQAAQQLVAADTTAQIPRQHQQREEKLKKRTTSHAGRV